jgi:hypothetical protein
VTPFLPVLHVCTKDAPLFERTLELCRHFEPSVPYTCLISHERGFDPSTIVELAKPFFARVATFIYDPWKGRSSWPAPQNHAWQETARHIASLKQPVSWLWWEADATPLRAGWLQALHEAHQASGKPFSGHVVSTMGHMNGVAIYPHRVSRYSTRALLHKEPHPFDRVLSLDIKGAINPLNSLISHYLKDNHVGIHFTSHDEVAMAIGPDAVLFHGCDDGSLIDVLMHKRGPVARLLQSLTKWKYGKGRFSARSALQRLVTFHIPKPLPQVVHCLERHKQSSKDAERRVSQAFDSWLTLYKTGDVLPCHVWHYPRNSDQLGDSRSLPYLKDVLLEGLNACPEDGLVMWTNDDTILHPELPALLAEEVARKGAVSSLRINFDRGSIPALSLPPAEIHKLSAALDPPGDIDLGRDLFCFRKDWLRLHWHEIPDFLLGEFEFDLCLAFLIRKHAGIRTTKANWEAIIPACEIPRGYVIHERHERVWTSRTAAASPAKAHNRRLSLEFYSDNELHALISTRM